MHICADEIVAVSTVLTSALPFIPRVRAFIKRIFSRKVAAAPVPPSPSPMDADAEELNLWLEQVAPLLYNNTTPYSLEQRTLKDGSGFLYRVPTDCRRLATRGTVTLSVP